VGAAGAAHEDLRSEMMAHLSNSELQAFLRRDLPAERLLEIDDHLLGCATCRETLERGPETAELLGQMEANFTETGHCPGHLDYEHLRSLMQSDSAPVEATRHVSTCPKCAAELAELKRFADEVDATPRAAKPKPQLVPAKAPGAVRPWSIGPGWYGLAGAVLLLAFVGLVVRHRVLRASHDAVARLRDGGEELFVDQDGELHGDEGLEDAYREQLRQVMVAGRLPSAPVVNLGGPQRETLPGVASELREAQLHHPDDALLLAVLYARAGAIDEARGAMDRLAAENPDSPLVARLRASLPQAPSPIKSNAAQ